MNPNERQPNQPSLSKQPTTPPAAAPGQTPVRPTPASGDTAHTQSGHDTLGGAPSGRAPGESLDIERKVFAERFDLLEELGSGGMGRVLKAFDRKLQRAVAVKRIKGPLATDPDLLRRFLREAQFAARLNHPNVVTVHDILTDDEGPYLVLEFIDGESLADRLQRGGAIPWRDAIALIVPICNAVHSAHKLGIIHRDIKPANIMLQKTGQPKLGDFGIAKSLDGVDLTQTKAAMGTIAYGAPEQFQSARTADARSDVYSLAATLYHMVTGEIPQPISAEELPVEIRTEVLKGLLRYPEKRYASALELLEGLARFLGPDLQSPETSKGPAPFSAVISSTRTISANVPTVTVAVPSTAFEGDVAGDRQEITQGMYFRWCPAGSITLNCPASDMYANSTIPDVKVSLPHGFWMSESLVTQQQFQSIAEYAPWSEFGIKQYYKIGDLFPAVYIDYYEAMAFCEVFTEIERKSGHLPSDWRFALPTETQMEYAFLSGANGNTAFGGYDMRREEYAWLDKFKVDEDHKNLLRPTVRHVNQWGIQDLCGTVWEWCSDAFNPQVRRETDPFDVTHEHRMHRTLRGGSWYFYDRDTRTSYRDLFAPGNQITLNGFRVVCVYDEPDSSSDP